MHLWRICRHLSSSVTWSILYLPKQGKLSSMVALRAKYIGIYCCATGRAIWGNIQFEGGSIGSTVGSRAHAEPEK